MKISLASCNFIENWDFTNPDKAGIGGSETSQIELAWRLAARGHEVVSYAPVPWSGTKEWRGTTWTHYDNADYSRDGLWLVYRSPSMADQFRPCGKRKNQRLYFIAQDVWYSDWSKDRLSKFDRYVCLCRDHAIDMKKRWPSIADRICISSNGIKGEQIDQVLSEGIVRNPKKIIYASSPDRGLANAVSVFKRAREYDPQLEFHYYYGWDNVDKIIARCLEAGEEARAFLVKRDRDIVQGAVEIGGTAGITNHGRIPQPELYREIASAAVWLYPTAFTETFGTTSCEMQALGAIPITNPIWGLRDNVLNGVIIYGNPNVDLLVRSRYVGELLRLCSGAASPQIQDHIRTKMMADARAKFDWETTVDQIVGWAESDSADKSAQMELAACS